VIGHGLLGVALVVSGDFPEGQDHLDRAEALYDPEAHSRPLLTKFGFDFALFLTFRSYARWVLGRPEAARADIERALGDARRIGPGVTLMGVLHLTATTQLRLGEIAAAKAQADELVALAKEKSAPAFIAHGMADQCCVLASSGETSKAAPSFEEAITYDRSLWWEAEFHRTAGEIELMAPEPDAVNAQTSFERALEISRAQQARSFELRAATSLARLRRDQGCRSEARDLLAPVYGWFTEGFETPDLKAAKALLEELAYAAHARIDGRNSLPVVRSVEGSRGPRTIRRSAALRRRSHSVGEGVGRKGAKLLVLSRRRRWAMIVEAPSGRHHSSKPALRRPSRVGSICARYVGSSLIVDQTPRAREREKTGLSVRPVLIAECASSSCPRCASADPNRKCGCGKFRLASIAR